MVRWSNFRSSLSSRTFILNHYLLPSLIYYISCWKLATYQLNWVYSITKNFLWGSTKNSRKQPRVASQICCLSKDQGGLGLLSLDKLSIKLNAKWILRSIHSDDFWALLLKRHCHKFKVEKYPSWYSLSFKEILFLAGTKMLPYGSQLVKGFWKAWLHMMEGWKPPWTSKVLVVKESLWLSYRLKKS